MVPQLIDRRRFITKATLASSAIGLFGCKGSLSTNANQEKIKLGLKRNIHHSVCRWCFDSIPLDQFIKGISEIGISAIDLVGPKDWPLLKNNNIDSSMCNGAELNLTDGWNNPDFHPKLINNYKEMIGEVSEAGYKNLICFSGNRNGMDDATGMDNCVNGLNAVIPYAESKGITIQMELFNSKVNHPDYMCDSTEWGVDLCKKIDSPNFKLLYDIYHMQIQEGDIIRTINDFHPFFGHYHTAGVPGRHEIDESQELYYPAIMEAIEKTGFEGYVAQEFIPINEDKLASLKKAIVICDV